MKTANRYGVTPLSEAAAKGSAALIEALLKAGAAPNTLTTPEGETVLMTASRNGNVEAVKVLLAHKADPNAKEEYRGQTALMWAAAEGHPDILKLLLAAGADYKVRSRDRDATPPKLSNGSPIAPISRGGLTALHWCARRASRVRARVACSGRRRSQPAGFGRQQRSEPRVLNTHYELASSCSTRRATPTSANKDDAALFMAIDMHDIDWSPALPAKSWTRSRASIRQVRGRARRQRERAVDQLVHHRSFAQDHGDKTLAAGAALSCAPREAPTSR